MSFKPLDLQMSIPRTQEFSTMQSQAAHKPVADQNMLANQSAKDTELMRSQNSEVEQSDKPKMRMNEDGQHGSSYRNGSGNRKEDKDKEDGADPTPVHPYKGHNLDIKL